MLAKMGHAGVFDRDRSTIRLRLRRGGGLVCSGIGDEVGFQSIGQANFSVCPFAEIRVEPRKICLVFNFLEARGSFLL